MLKPQKRSHIDEGLQGAAFGVTEAVIMMMGVMYALIVTGDRQIVILGILASGVADALANSAAFHISEEAEAMHSHLEVWKSTLMCFFGTAVPVALFIIPLLVFPISLAMIIDGVFGLLLLALTGVYVGAKCKTKRGYWHIAEYTLMGIAVPLVCYIIGRLVMKLV